MVSKPNLRPAGDIPAYLLKVTLDVHLSLVTKIINLPLENGCSPDDLKLAEVRPIFKKIIGLSVLYLMSQRSLKESFTAKLMCSCKISRQTY